MWQNCLLSFAGLLDFNLFGVPYVCTYIIYLYSVSVFSYLYLSTYIYHVVCVPATTVLFVCSLILISFLSQLLENMVKGNVQDSFYRNNTNLNLCVGSAFGCNLTLA